MKISTLQLSHKREKQYHIEEAHDERIIEGIKTNSNSIIAEIYEVYFAKIRSMVLAFHNTILDPEDIFQEGLTRAIVNIQAGKFRKESSFATYLNSICRNICLKQLSRKNMLDIDGQPEIADENEANYELLNELLLIREQLDSRCRKIIDLRFAQDEATAVVPQNKCMSFDEIAENLGINAANARQRFKRCLEKLRLLVSKSQELSEYLS